MWVIFRNRGTSRAKAAFWYLDVVFGSALAAKQAQHLSQISWQGCLEVQAAAGATLCQPRRADFLAGAALCQGTGISLGCFLFFSGILCFVLFLLLLLLLFLCFSCLITFCFCFCFCVLLLLLLLLLQLQIDKLEALQVLLQVARFVYCAACSKEPAPVRCDLL